MQHQDWKSVDIGRQTGGKLTKEEIAIKDRQAKRLGQCSSIKKQGGFSGNNRKLDEATEASKIEYLKCGQDIMKGRTSKKFDRKKLAQMVNKKVEVIADFENNKALATPQNKQLLNKIKRVLGI